MCEKWVEIQIRLKLARSSYNYMWITIQQQVIYTQIVNFINANIITKHAVKQMKKTESTQRIQTSANASIKGGQTMTY